MQSLIINIHVAAQCSCVTPFVGDSAANVSYKELWISTQEPTQAESQQRSVY